MQPTFDVLDAIERQAEACDHIGSPLYTTLLRGLAADHRAGGVTRDLLESASERPQHDAIPLRYLAIGHRLALAGSAQDLARHYPSCGGEWHGADPTRDFLALVHARRADFVDGLTRQVQTNEVARAVPLACGLAHLQQMFALPLRTFELGASAGLLSRLAWFRIETPFAACGPADARLHFGPEWFTTPPHTLPALLDVVHQEAVDLTPIDVATSAGRIAIQSFLWPDQLERIDRLRAAMVIAEEHPLQVDADDAGAWLQRRLAVADGATTVVFHSIVWQYLPDPTRRQLRATLTAVGATATRTAPLCWLRMEPATATHADLRATVWDGCAQPSEHHLADVGYHGHNLSWLA